MYVTHLAAWGFVKNYTEARVGKILHQKREGDAVNKVSKFGGEGKWADFQGIEKYLTRKKKDIETFIPADEEGAGIIDVEVSTYSPSARERHPPPQPLNHGDYEHNCPYQQWTKKFRLIEKFSKYFILCAERIVYKGLMIL
jgi:hypothetical protein